MMKNFQKRRGLKEIMQSKIVLIFLGMLIVFFAWNVFNLLRKMQETRNNRIIAENKVLELQKSKEKLSLDIQNLKTDKGKEENIRDKFGLAKDGENVIVIIDDKNQIQNQKEPESKSFLSLIKNWFR